jgi:hypothetical protein
MKKLELTIAEQRILKFHFAFCNLYLLHSVSLFLLFKP